MPATKNHPQKKKHYEGLTYQQGRFVNELARQALEKGKINGTKAALVAYDATHSSARTIASRLLAKVDVRKAFLAEMDSKGLTDEVSIGAFKRAFTAKRRQRNYETGEVFYEDDHAVQLRAVQEYHKVKGLYPDKQTITKRATLNLYAEMTPQQLEVAEKHLVAEVRQLEASLEREPASDLAARPSEERD